MKSQIKSFLCFIVWLVVSVPVLFCASAHAQIHNPVKWSFAAAPSSTDSEAILMLTATVEEGWHIYSQFMESGGPLPTTFTFVPGKDYSLVGKVKEEGSLVKAYDETFMMNVLWFANSVTFIQRVKLNIPATEIKGKVEFMVCNDHQCLPPDEVSFILKVKTNQQKEKKDENVIAHPEISENDTVKTDSIPAQALNSESPVVADSLSTVIVKVSPEHSDPPVSKAEQSIWTIFIAGFFGGLAAIIMPCIFPMIPFTVGIFSKRGTIREGSVLLSIFFGISIVLIYVILGLLVTVIFGSDALNNISTNGFFNLFFFLLLVVFAASFLGAFEITLPSAWVTKVDAQADRSGVFGIFFMAATLVLVSFSCTGPLIGTLLVEAASLDSFKGPAIGMFGFAIALALPFTLFSMFPSWLKALPKSGGWLNSVKVTLGFLELALALKFLSNVDLAYHWNLFDREVFLVLWIIIFGLLGFYLLGKIRLTGDSEIISLSTVRLFLSMLVLAFTLYMIPGLWGAPLKSISAFLPPPHTQDFDLSAIASAKADFSSTQSNVSLSGVEGSRKYANLFHAPYNLNAFFDYQEGIAYARKVNKPVIIDFTGHACVNCRKMETVVWSDPRINNRLKEDYILVQLYVDDKTELPAKEQYTSTFSGKEITTIGNKWSDFQASTFNANSQPYYVLLDLKEKTLVPPQGAEYDVELFKEYLDSGLQEFKNR